jgi:amyloid beta precursor protein binding protein 1
MHSSTNSFIALQNLFKGQYIADLERFRGLLSDVLAGLGLSADAIPDDEVEGFVKNTGGVAIVKGRPLRESKEVKGLLPKAIGE